MEVSFNTFSQVAATLPISYYLGSGIELEISETADTPYFDPFHNKVVLSYPNLKAVFEHITGAESLEMYIRSDLYHEIGHVILTPKEFMTPVISTGLNQILTKDIFNIFEDERLETLLQDFFMGVNFKKSIIDINGFHEQPPQSVMDNFFQICRFRFGKPEFVHRVGEIINRYGLDNSGNYIINAQTSRYNYNEYQQEIIQLFKDVAKDWMEENKKNKLTGKDPGYDALSEGEKQEIVDQIMNEQSDSGQEGCSYQYIKDLTINEDGSVTGATQDGKPITISAEELKDALEAASAELDEAKPGPRSENKPHEHKGNPRAKIQEMLKSMLNEFIDPQIIDTLDMVITRFVNRTKQNGAALARHSGVLNPRLLGVKEYAQQWKIFTYKSNDGPINGFSKLHLNLYIDTSGSYCSNVHQTNRILKALDILEQRYPFFYFDLVTCQVGERLRSKNERYIKAYGGNDIDNHVWEIHRKLNDPRSYNIDIVLFDGNAFTDCCGSVSQHAKNFGVWNSTHASIISDVENQTYIERYAPQAHHFFVDKSQKKSYAQLLYENIEKALTFALM